MKSFSYRQVNVAALLLCTAYLSAAFLLQHFLNLPPCPLCILQRWIVFLLFIIFLLASIWARSSLHARLFAVLTFIFSALGVFLAGRHLWLLAHPANNLGICAPDLSYLFKQLPFTEVVKTLFLGSGDCATMAGTFLGISIPLWTLLGFSSLLLISIWQIVRRNSSTPRW